MTMIQQPTGDDDHKPKPLLLWLSNFKSIINDLPNPSISKLFIISNAATFSLEILMIIEWILHGRYHRGFRWIIYYASSIIALSFLTLIVCFIAAVAYSNDSRKADQAINKSEEEEEDGRIEEEEESVDRHAMVVLEQSADRNGGGFELEDGESLMISMGNGGEERDEKWMILRRSVTLPLFKTVVHVENKIKRRSSFC